MQKHKGFIYLRAQRLCVGAKDDAHIGAQELGSLFGYRPKEDHELDSALRVLGAVFNDDRDSSKGARVQ